MVRDPITIDGATTVADAVNNHFMSHGHGGYPVVSDGRVTGLITLSEVRHCALEERGQKRVSEITRDRASYRYRSRRAGFQCTATNGAEQQRPADRDGAGPADGADYAVGDRALYHGAQPTRLRGAGRDEGRGGP